MARPKGYATWSPKPETEQLVRAVKQVLQEYKAHLPLTVRQIFYRLVGQYGYDKTELAYSRLCEHLVRARRAQMIPFEHIRDDGTVHHEFSMYLGEADFWAQMKKHADYYSRDKLAQQPVHIELWCEAAGMVPQLERVANRYSVPVYSTGGFSSVTVTYEIAERALSRKKPTVFLHCGDFDPSGESIFEAQATDARSFLYNRLRWELETQVNDARLDVPTKARAQAVLDCFPGRRLFPEEELPPWSADLIPTRVALTEEQVDEYDLPTAPPKKSDTRSVNWTGETCQLEALPPDTLADIVEAAIEEVLDLDLLEVVREEESEERDTVMEQIAQFLDDTK